MAAPPRRDMPAIAALLAAGGVAVAVGAAGLVAPDAFHAASGVVVGDDAGLLSELRAASGVVLAAGIGLLAGVARPRLAGPALFAGSALYLSYAVGRAVAWAADGWPGPSLLTAGVVEGVIGVACAVTLLRRRARSGG
ncbi:DUF4345 domain-containing protein [Cellulomonas cellasea]|uniref:DUF4345 domain-containing protein n=1 Tax=Cellulomonas cellasea TaxID=43670 RepID=UPI0025A48078|nr:DUF4345 domain-containing protein [Cellulomonas cellasea]MDM8084489.1 DUF4345 domain-containing protein [Cellulomonas cellasea]